MEEVPHVLGGSSERIGRQTDTAVSQRRQRLRAGLVTGMKLEPVDGGLLLEEPLHQPQSVHSRYGAAVKDILTGFVGFTQSALSNSPFRNVVKILSDR